MVKLFASTKRLSAFKLECYNMIPECLEKVPETLESMTVELDYECTTETVEKALENCPKLHTLQVSCGAEEGQYHSLIKSIIVNGRQRNFKIFSITAAAYGYMHNAHLIASFTNLQSLKLDIGENLSDSILRKIGRNLDLLLSFTLYGIKDGPQFITDRGLKTLANLKYLKLHSVNLVTGECFKRITELESVELLLCEGIKTPGLQVLFKSAKNLRSLALFKEDPKKYIDCMKAVPKTRANKVPLKIRLKLFGSGDDTCVYRDGYLTVEEYHTR
ncbi:uncharacterized protein LOC100118612 isoform X4 [Nasonia vitripennis]|uniref:Uncharacterized protein n=1 Tax=Nasonia vitripennis TaxID=7425 RepID=A0A7M7J2N6_NASVI|nr:uncharacterized protein LOC100118612 isoform X4 [Nasonia vitripennis]